MPATAARADSSSGAPAGISPLASGAAWSLGLDGGASASAYSVAPALGEDAGFGMYLRSSERSAWSLEVYEAANLVLDRTTPEFGFVGGGARRFGRPEHAMLGPPGKTIDFERLAAGVAFAYDGRQLVTGLGAEATVAYLVHGAHGLSVRLGGYFFNSSDLSRNTLVLLSVGYVFSPVAYHPYHAFEGPKRDETGACRDASAYRYALAEIRKQIAEVCKDEHAPACAHLRARTGELNADLNKCLLGVDVGPPLVPDDP